MRSYVESSKVKLPEGGWKFLLDTDNGKIPSKDGVPRTISPRLPVGPGGPDWLDGAPFRGRTIVIASVHATTKVELKKRVNVAIIDN